MASTSSGMCTYRIILPWTNAMSIFLTKPWQGNDVAQKVTISHEKLRSRLSKGRPSLIPFTAAKLNRLYFLVVCPKKAVIPKGLRVALAAIRSKASTLSHYFSTMSRTHSGTPRATRLEQARAQIHEILQGDCYDGMPSHV